MTLTVATMLAWRPNDLGAAADEFEVSRRAVDDLTMNLRTVIRSLEDVWTGEAAGAATATLREHAATGERLNETLSLVHRTLRAAADAFAAAQALLRDAQSRADAHGLHVQDDGRVFAATSYLISASATPVQRAAADRELHASLNAAERAQAMARQALAAAEEADADAAAALRAAWDATQDGSGWDEADTAMIAAITDRAIPATGTAPADVAAWWASLAPLARSLMLVRHYTEIGNLDGVPYDVRIAANRSAIGDALDRAQDDEPRLLAELAALQAQLPKPGSFSAGGRGYPDPAVLQALGKVQADLATARAAVARYRELLNGPTYVPGSDGTLQTVVGHQVVLFDPEHGRFAEVVGSLTAQTASIGVLIGGTGTNVAGMVGEYTRAYDFVSNAYPRGSLVVITYLGGPMPQDLIEAVDSSYAVNQAGALRSFAAGIDRPDGAMVTVVGHSYGGSVVGAAEHAGMVVDKVVHVESAGAGPGVNGVEDYAAPATPRYSMTAPGDPIGLFQGVHVGSWGHGADPDTLPGVVRLDTGRVDANDPNSPLLEGSSAHGGVFTRGSTAWTNILNVMTGQDAKLSIAPTVTAEDLHNLGRPAPLSGLALGQSVAPIW